MKCGQPQGVAASEPEFPVVDASLGCIKCGADLPEGAQFCLKCGKPVSSPAKRPAAKVPPIVGAPMPAVAKPRRTRRLVLWLFLLIVLGVIVWAAASESPVAQGIQELVGWKHDQTVVDSPFSISPGSFRYYKFPLPEGSVNVDIIGQFTVTGEAPKGGSAKGKDKDADKDSNNVEVYVLSEPAFTVWQNGYATRSLYESGRVTEGKVNQELPAGAGIYYLVFSNKFAPKAGKSVQASVLLRYKSWLPESLRRMNDRFWNWVGL